MTSDVAKPREVVPPYARLRDHSVQSFNQFSEGSLPGYLGIEILSTDPRRLRCRLPLRPVLLAPNGYLHGGTLVAVADNLCGYGSIVNLPADAIGFTTIELKSNFLTTVREGTVFCEATPAHLGRNTHVWDASVTDASGRLLTMFRCTQMVLWRRS